MIVKPGVLEHIKKAIEVGMIASINPVAVLSIILDLEEARAQNDAMLAALELVMQRSTRYDHYNPPLDGASLSHDDIQVIRNAITYGRGSAE